MRNRWWVTTTLAAAVLTVAACGGSAKGGSTPTAGSASGGSTGTSSAAASAASAAMVKATQLGGVTVLTKAKGVTLYWFVPDTSTTSRCYGSCAQYWPPVKGPVTAATGLMGTFGTIKRTGGELQATYDGHPLYTYIGDSHPGQASGNDINLNGGLWYEVRVSSG